MTKGAAAAFRPFASRLRMPTERTIALGAALNLRKLPEPPGKGTSVARRL